MLFKSIFPVFRLPEIDIYEFMIPYFDKEPNKILFIDSVTGNYLTFNHVKNAIHRIASGLLQKGFIKGDMFVLFMENCVEYILTFYAILAIRGVIVLIDSYSTTYDLLPKLQDFDRKSLFILTNKANIAKVNDAIEKLGKFKGCFVLDDNVDGFEPFSKLLYDTSYIFTSHVPIDVNDTAIIVYSSGTTSKPKGVMLTHKNLVSYLCVIASQSTMIQSSEIFRAYLAVIPFSHVSAVLTSMSGQILFGSTIVILPRFQPHLFLSAIQKYKITIITISPAIMYFMAKSTLLEKYNLSSIKLIGCGGAPLSSEIAEQIKNKFNAIIRQGYGLTENTGYAFIFVQGLTSKGSVGILAPGIESKIIEEESGESLGPNKLGEICIKGPNIMKGYLNNEEATRQSIDSDGFLHTGDIGYFDNNNSLFVIDRAKELIKYAGYPVPPATLESLLIEHPDVEDVAVSSIPDEEYGELPKAYIVRKNPKLTEREIIEYVQSKVASHMFLRGGVEFIKIIPKTETGKILRRQLKQAAFEEVLKPNFN